MGGHALDHRGCALLKTHAVGQGNDDPRRDQRVFGVGANRQPVGHPVAHGNAGHAFAQRVDDARGFHAGGKGRGDGIPAPAVIGVDEVDAGGLHLHPHLARTRFGHRCVFVFEYIRVAGFVDSDRFHWITSERVGKRILRISYCVSSVDRRKSGDGWAVPGDFRYAANATTYEIRTTQYVHIGPNFPSGSRAFFTRAKNAPPGRLPSQGESDAPRRSRPLSP